MKTYLDTKVDDSGALMYKLPTVLHLKKTYRESSSRSSRSRNVVLESKEPTRKQPVRSKKNAGRWRNTTGKKRHTRKRR